MSKRNYLPILVTVVVALLAVDVVLRLEPREAAARPAPQVRIIEIAGESTRLDEQRFLWRLWSDGTIEENSRSAVNGPWQGWEIVPEVP